MRNSIIVYPLLLLLLLSTINCIKASDTDDDYSIFIEITFVTGILLMVLLSILTLMIIIWIIAYIINHIYIKKTNTYDNLVNDNLVNDIDLFETRRESIENNL